MKVLDPKQWGVFLAVASLVSAVGIPMALGELVFDPPVAQPEQESMQANPIHQVNQANPGDERESLRQVMGASERAQATSQGNSQGNRQNVTVLTTTASNSVSAIDNPEVQHLSKSELMRRERMREEMKNEDILQERIEELRLRDERRRTEEVLGRSAASSAIGSSVPSSSLSGQEVIVAPITERSQSSIAVATVTAPPTAPVIASVSSPEQSLYDEDQDETRIGLSPRIGLSDMSGNSFYNVAGRYTVGLGMDIGVSDNVTFELGYSFSEFGVAIASTNPWVNSFQMWNGSQSLNSNETLAMKQNVVDAGLKLHLLGSSSRLRPFVGGGAAYSKSYINYDSRITDYLYQGGLSNLARDYEVSSFLGYLSTGFDVKLSRSVSVGAAFKYYRVLTARENQSLNGMAFTGYPGYGANMGNYSYLQPQAPMDLEKSIVGGSLARSSFYSVTAGVNFEF